MARPDHIPLLPQEEYQRRQRRSNSSLQAIWSLLDQVTDPEIPVVSLWELGVLQDIALREATVLVTITPTYSGCPAMSAMEEDIVRVLGASGYTNVEVVTRLAPAWSTQWMSEQARDKLRAYGIAPPGRQRDEDVAISCPRCASTNVQCLSEFGSTACKALYQCSDCAEPFDYFKPI